MDFTLNDGKEKSFLNSLCEKIANKANVVIDQQEINRLYQCMNMTNNCHLFRDEDCRTIFQNIKCIIQYIIDTRRIYPKWRFEHISIGYASQGIPLFHITFKSYEFMTYHRIGNKDSDVSMDVFFNEEDIKLMDELYEW